MLQRIYSIRQKQNLMKLDKFSKQVRWDNRDAMRVENMMA